MDDNKYLKEQELIDYPGKKLPVVFCVDVSDSMNACKGGVDTGRTEVSDGKTWRIVEGGHSIIQNVKERVKDFHEAMTNDEKASVTCQTAYVVFGDSARKIEDFGVVKDKPAPIDKLVARDSDTFIVDGLRQSLEMLDEQKALLKKSSNKYFQPWLIILTDGLAHDDPEEIKKIKRELQQRQRENKLIVYTMALNEDEELYNQIRGYSIYKPIPFDKDSNELKRFFAFLKQSISAVSNNKTSSDKIPGYTDAEDASHLQ